MVSRALHISETRMPTRRIASAGFTRVCWLCLGSLIILLPALIWGIPSNRNLVNHFRFALPFYESLRAGHWYPGWLAESNGGYGDASFRFYPPGTYYLLILSRTIAGNWYAGSLITFGLLLALGSIGIYLWAREFLSANKAMLAGLLYLVAPYHLTQLYQASFLAEFAGAAVLPFVFAFAEKICGRRRLQDVTGLAASYALLVLTHLPLTVIGSIALGIYVLLRLEKGTKWKTIGSIAIATILGLTASACYWTTMVAELSWIRADNINPDPNVDYRKNFILSTLSPDYLNVWWMNILLLATVGLFWPGVASLGRFVTGAGKKRIATCVVVLFSIFMSTPLSRPLWALIRPLQETQFPWRWLAITSALCPIMLALSLPFWVRLWHGRTRPVVLLAAGTMAMSLAFSASHIIREAQYLNIREFEATLRTIPGTQSVTQWWPAWVNEPLKGMDKPVDAGARSVSVQTWMPEERIFQVAAGAGDARIRTFYYPHWKAFSEGKPLAVHADTDGALIISLPEQASTVLLEFREPVRVYWAAVATLIGWLVITILALVGVRRHVHTRISSTELVPSF